ncbi:polysaccharide biosynthesis tyrosine autokinase [Novosphingobium sp. PhB165]|uniref:GumC family protein n=1 Tax=Novosphingobium sp. PhB165 TaxID=2485105 RepID=UPI0014054DAC|nr:polysaccharide biosynthesis tyrosine autokinase [Novosphingobium sp. PhB165]
MILLIVGITTTAVLIQQLLSPTLYKSTTNVQVELIDQVGTNQADVNSRNAERVANAVRLHRSGSAAEQVIKDLNLLHNPDFLNEMGNPTLTGKPLLQAAVNKLLSMITIDSEAGSDLIEISVVARSPELAADIANEIPPAVRALRGAMTNERRSELLASLEQEQQARGRTAVASAQLVADFRERNHMLAGAGTDEDLAQINRIAVQSAAATAARDGAAARSAGIARASTMQSTAMVTSAALDQLERHRGELVGEASKLSTSLGPNHPDVKRVHSELAAVDKSIADERAAVQAAAQADVAAKGDQMAQIARSEADGDAAQASRLEGIVAGLSSMAYHNTENRVELDKLLRQADLDDQAYKSISARIEQVRAQMQMEGVSSSVVSPAVPDYNPVAPTPFKLALTAFVGSSLLALMIAYLRDFLDDRLRTMAQIRRQFGLPTLGMLPLLTRDTSFDPKDSPVIKEPQSLFAEVARSTYSEVRGLQRRAGVQVVLVTSPLPGDGKSTVSLTLAAAGIALGERTVVLDLDLRKRGALQQLQNESSAPDLVDIVCGRAELDSLAIPHQGNPYDQDEPLSSDAIARQIVLLSAKEPVAEPAVLLSSNRLRILLGQLRERFDLVIINAPATLAVRDARAMCNFADQTVMVARWGHTTGDQMRAALESLDDSVGGVIFDQVDYAEHARRRYGDSVQFYADSASYYTSSVAGREAWAARIRRFFRGHSWRPSEV